MKFCQIQSSFMLLFVMVFLVGQPFIGKLFASDRVAFDYPNNDSDERSLGARVKGRSVPLSSSSPTTTTGDLRFEPVTHNDRSTSQARDVVYEKAKRRKHRKRPKRPSNHQYVPDQFRNPNDSGFYLPPIPPFDLYTTPTHKLDRRAQVDHPELYRRQPMTGHQSTLPQSWTASDFNQRPVPGPVRSYLRLPRRVIDPAFLEAQTANPNWISSPAVGRSHRRLRRNVIDPAQFEVQTANPNQNHPPPGFTTFQVKVPAHPINPAFLETQTANVNQISTPPPGFNRFDVKAPDHPIDPALLGTQTANFNQ